jgi:general secretion pathway protein G
MGRNNSKTTLLRRGFTLIELLIVIAIIGLLAVLGIWAYKNQLLKARDAQRKSDMKKIQVAVEEYEKDHDCYPSIDMVVCDPGDGLQPYLQKIPCDPLTGESYYYEPEGKTCAGWYRLYGLLDYSGDASIIEEIGPGGAYNYYVSSPNAPIIAVATPTPRPTAVPTAGPTPPETVYFGCVDHVCVQLSSQHQCSPNYSWGYPVSCRDGDCCYNKCVLNPPEYQPCIGEDGRAPQF